MKHLLRATLLGALLAGAAACENDPTGAGPPAAVTVAAGGDQTATAGQVLAQPVVVRVTDQDGDPVQGVEVRFAVTSGGGSVYPDVDSTDAQGQAGTEWRLGTVSADSQRVQVQVMNPRGGGVAATTVVRATAQPLAGRTLLRVSGEGQTGAVGTTLADSLTVRLVDELGNGVPGATVTWTVTPHGGAVSPAPSTTRADGTARVAWTLGVVTGAAGVVASVPGLPGVTFNGAATSPFTITITQPASRAYGDSLPIQATAQSATGPIARMTARVEDRSVNLSSGQGTLNLAGLPEGEKALLVWAVTAAGDSGAAVRRFIVNRAPQLTVVAPVRGSVIRTGAARIDADCADPSGCTRVAVYAANRPDATPSEYTLLGEGTTSFHGDVSLAAYNGRRKALFIEATDGLGGVSRVVISPVFVESTPTWTEVASGGLQALDVDATRILYMDSVNGTARVYVRALAGGTPTELLAAPAGADVVKGRLFPGGAIFATEDGIYEHRNGGTTQLAVTPSLGYTLDVEGSWAVWNVGNTLYRRDLVSGISVVVSPTSLNNGNHVAANGDVAYSSTVDDEVYLWRNGVSTPVSNGLRGYYPVTDGTQVVWGTGGGSTYAWRGPGTAQLLSTVTPQVTAPVWYEVNGGWAAFIKADVGGIGNVFTLAPDGTRRQASFGGQSRIAALAPDGTVVHTRLGVSRRFLMEPPYTGQPLDVGGALGEMRFVGTDLYVFVGRSAFRVNY